MIALSKVDLVLHYEAIIETALRIALVKSAPIPIRALTVDLGTVKQLKLGALTGRVQLVDVLATTLGLTELFAGEGCHAGPCVNDQSLRLHVRTHKHSDIVVHEVCRVTIQGGCLDVHVSQVSAPIMVHSLFMAKLYATATTVL